MVSVAASYYNTLLCIVCSFLMKGYSIKVITNSILPIALLALTRKNYEIQINYSYQISGEIN